jgi:hypothetical protein
MLVVAMAGLVMGVGVWAWRMWRLSAEYAVQAQSYRFLVDISGYPVGQGTLVDTEATIDTNGELQTQDLKMRVERWTALARKWERAARYPWLPVEPDPPEPWLP